MFNSNMMTKQDCDSEIWKYIGANLMERIQILLHHTNDMF